MFITFEGTDGSGKTTAIKSLCKFLEKNQIDFILTQEPGTPKSKEAKKIRSFILNPTNNISSMVEALFYASDRRIHLEEVIWPALKENKVVICDRYLDSSLAYQGYARNLGIENILKINEIITEKTFPDVSFFLNVDYEESKKRMNKRQNTTIDRIEKESDAFKKRIYQGYLKVVKMFPKRFVVIDANQSKEKVFSQIEIKIRELLKI